MMINQNSRSLPDDIYFVAQFNTHSAGGPRTTSGPATAGEPLTAGGLGRYEQSLFPRLSQLTGAQLVPIEPWPVPGLLMRAARIAGCDLQAVARNYPSHLPNCDGASLIHLSHTTLLLGLLWRRLKHVVVTVHDIIPYLQMSAPQFGQAELNTIWDRLLYRFALRCLRQADAIIAVSHQTRRDLVARLGIPANSITVVPLGVDREIFKRLGVPRSIYDRFGLKATEQYILYVGSQESRKNLSIVYRALREIHRHNQAVRLLVAGSPRSPLADSRQIRLIHEAGIEGLVYFLGFVSEYELACLYNLSRALVMPSLYEGFGLPVLEAMASGCPVVAADATSLPEAVGAAGLFAGPHDLNGWRVAVESVLEDEVLRKQLIEAGFDRARDFSWEATAAATSAVYHKVLN